MLKFPIDNVTVEISGRNFQQPVGIPMGTNRVLLLADISLRT